MRKLAVSKGNMKLGGVPNISLTPGESCRNPAPCLTEGCYAMKSFRQYPNVREAWGGNLGLWLEDPGSFEKDLSEYLAKKNPKYFRYHVGGDIPDQDYLNMMSHTAENHTGTKFLAFTKKYELSFSGLPSNMMVVLSAWPGLDLPEDNQGLPTAWLSSDERAPKGVGHVICVGHCGICGYQCWEKLGDGVDVIFNKH